MVGPRCCSSKCGRPRASSLAGDGAADQEALDVARTLVDHAYADVPVNALHGKVGDVAVASVDLDRIRADLLGHFAGKKLSHRGFLQAEPARVAQGGGVPDHLARDLDPCRHVGKAKVYGLMPDDGLAEGGAFAGI